MFKYGDTVKFANLLDIPEAVRILDPIGYVIARPDNVHLPVGFTLTYAQFGLFESFWGAGYVCMQEMARLGIDSSHPRIRSWNFNPAWFIPLRAPLSKEQQELLDQLRKKEGRSPVEEFILSELE